MNDAAARVHVVDDDDAVRDSLQLLLKSVGLESACYSNAQSFLDDYADEPGCLILDIRMPGISGLALQKEIRQRGWLIPIIFITGHGDIPMAVEAMREGALDFLQKPFREEELLQRISDAMERDNEIRRHNKARAARDARLDGLTPRETEIAQRIVNGQANKVIAMELGISLRTVELHRARIMEKMQVRSVAELVQVMLET